MEKEVQAPVASVSTAPKVYQAIVNVMAALAKDGISKDRKNQQQGYNFRGIDDVYNALAQKLSDNKLCMLPISMSPTREERATKNGGTLFYVNISAEFELISAEDGSSKIIQVLGEAMDSGDKATNKSMSAAYKYAALMAFCIPTEGDNDSENHTHEVVAKAPSAPAPKPGDFWTRQKLTIPFSSRHMPVDGQFAPEAWADWEKNFLAAIEKVPDRELLARLQSDNQHILDQFESPKTFELNEACAKRAATFK